MGSPILRIIVLVLVSNPSLIHGCQDVDLFLCTFLKTSHPDMCTDRCMSTLCQKSCGACHLECFSCANIADISQCQSTKLCPNPDDVCFIAQTFTERFVESYTLGCSSYQNCRQYHEIDRHYRINVDAGCCNTPRCNNRPPTLLKLNTTVVHKVSKSTNSSSCIDIDLNVCKQLLDRNQNICSNECVSKQICPGTCQYCSGNTHNHTYQKVPSLSLNTTTAFPRTASSVTQISSTTFPSSNGNISTASTSLTTPELIDCRYAYHTRCPDTFVHHHNECYMRGPIPLTQTESQAYCERQCLRLAEFDSVSEMTSIIRNFVHHLHDQPMYVGARRINHLQSWEWIKGHLNVNPLLWVKIPYESTGDCVVAGEEEVSPRRWAFGLKLVNCTQKFKPLCQMFLNH